MRISAKVDYAVRAAIELTGASRDSPTKGDLISTRQGIPLKFLENILSDMRHAGIVASRRGADGGYWLAQAPTEISVADVIRAVEGPMATVRGERPEQVEYSGSAEPLQRVWIAVRAALRSVAEEVTLANLASGDLPAHVDRLTDDPKAWVAPR